MGGPLFSLFVLTASVGIHEYGHYLVMIRNKVRVKQFFIGLGKPLWKYVLRTGTEFSVRPFLIGGAAVPYSIETDGEDCQGAIEHASRWARFRIYIAGIMANCMVAFVTLLIVGYGYGRVPSTLQPIADAVPEPFTVPVVALFGSFGICFLVPVLLVMMFASPHAGDTAPSDAVVGPIGIISMGSQASGTILDALFFIWAINVSIAGFNLIPLPPLDGGRILLLPLEKVLSKQAINSILAFFTFLFLGFFIYVIFNDVVRLF